MQRGWVRGGNLVVRPQIFDGARPIEKLPGGEGGHRYPLKSLLMHRGWVGWELSGQTSYILLRPFYREAPGRGWGGGHRYS